MRIVDEAVESGVRVGRVGDDLMCCQSASKIDPLSASKIDPSCEGLLEQGAIETTGGAIVDVFDARLLAEPCGAQPRG